LARRWLAANEPYDYVHPRLARGDDGEIALALGARLPPLFTSDAPHLGLLMRQPSLYEAEQ